MPELEFTGERVIPGLVDSNLFNEHFARYRFAARFAKDRMVLDAGCGAGYGSAQFGDARGIVAVDFSFDAVRYARTHYGLPHSRFSQARCEALPFSAASFGLITAFEVIEHLENWSALLTEANRVLTDTGLFLVSTPNKAYYAETRASAGPNPFHAHEFEYEEFRTALRQVFPYVEIWRQNHAEAILLECGAALTGELAIGDSGEEKQDQPHFFLAICSRNPIPPTPPFAWIPGTANVLREREHHIELLKEEVSKKNGWIAAMEVEVNASRAVIAERDSQLAERTRWVEGLQADLSAQAASLAAWKEQSLRLEQELKAVHVGYQGNAERLNGEIRELHAGYQAKIGALEQEMAETHRLYKNVVNDLEAQVASLQSDLRRFRDSKWYQLGMRFGFAPATNRD